ncbi:hypothetical protein [Thiohalorhabdus methylotrophus]|uniref:Uncharacterized protein n=1 Tax=Thiohalorhabdus methylotrophus TaxID=3242694 RepID=A0ABV4TRF2_9GAMM
MNKQELLDRAKQCLQELGYSDNPNEAWQALLRIEETEAVPKEGWEEEALEELKWIAQANPESIDIYQYHALIDFIITSVKESGVVPSFCQDFHAKVLRGELKPPKQKPGKDPKQNKARDYIIYRACTRLVSEYGIHLYGESKNRPSSVSIVSEALFSFSDSWARSGNPEASVKKICQNVEKRQRQG